jgi:hypothetical protein
MIYLASPYSSPDQLVRLGRFNHVCRHAAKMMAGGGVVFSPIAHTHPIAEQGHLPTGWGYWEKVDRAFLAACTEMVVLRLPGWEQSKGVAAELKIAQEMGLPVRYEDHT